MKYRQLVEQLPNKKVVFAFGRFNPPTNGHELLVNVVKRTAVGADHVIFVSKTQDKKKNPLPVDRKLYYLNRMFRGTKFVGATPTMRTFLEAADSLYSQGYRSVIMIAGSDRYRTFKQTLDKYNGKKDRHGYYKFDSIQVISSGSRDPDADDATGMSATKMRDAAKKGDFVRFKTGLPTTLTNVDARRLFNEVRHGLGLQPIRESIKFSVDKIREMYFQGKVFNIGDEVLVNEEVHEVIDRGSNYVVVVDQQGETHRKWITDCTVIEEKYHTKSGKIKGSPKDKETGLPKKYVKGLSKSTASARKAHWDKANKLSDSDPAAYKPAPGDATAKTKPSKHTKKFKQMYGEETVNYKNYQTKHFDMCPLAVTAFDKLIKKGVEDPRALLGAIKATDEYLGIEKAVVKSKSVTPQQMSDFENAQDRAKDFLKNLGDLDNHDYMKQHADKVKGFAEDWSNKYKRSIDCNNPKGFSQKAHCAGRKKNMQEATNYTTTEKLKIARIIAISLGADAGAVDKQTNTTQMMNQALRIVRRKPLTKNGYEILKSMLTTAKSAGIDYDEKLLPPQMKSLGMSENYTRKKMDVQASLTEKAEKSIAKKAEKTGIPAGILKQVYNRGVAAWNSGHRPGTTPEQWGHARVNSFATGGKTRHTADADLWKKVKKESVIQPTGDSTPVSKMQESVSEVDKGSDYNLAKSILRYKDMMRMVGKEAFEKSPAAYQDEEYEAVGETVFAKDIDEALSPKQKKLDKNKNGKLDADDFKKLRNESDKVTHSDQSGPGKGKALKDMSKSEHIDSMEHHEREQMIAHKKGQDWNAKHHAMMAKVHRVNATGGSSMMHREAASEIEFKNDGVKLPKDEEGAEKDKGFDAFFEDAEEMIKSDDKDKMDKLADEIADALSDEDFEDDYDEDEFAIVDDESGEEDEEETKEVIKKMKQDSVDEEAINEVLTRLGRIRAGQKLRRTKAKRARAKKIALRRYSTGNVLKGRARRMAVKALKKRFSQGRDPKKLSVAEKERLEKRIKKMTPILNRIQVKMIPKVRQIEKKRLSHSRFTK